MITLINYVDIDVSYSYEISTGCDLKKNAFYRSKNFKNYFLLNLNMSKQNKPCTRIHKANLISKHILINLHKYTD